MTTLKETIRQAHEAIEASEACEDCPFDYEDCPTCKYYDYAKRNP
jgi:hypothetical protein